MHNNETTRLLLLTGVLSGIGLSAVLIGCTITSADKENDNGGTSALVQDAAPATPPATKTDPKPPPSNDDDGDNGGGNNTGTGTGTKDSGATDSGNKDSGSKDGGAGAACLDDSAPAVQPACPTEGAGDECTAACADFATSWKKGLSAEIRKCMTAAICQAGTATCADKALVKACADNTTAAFCTPLVAGCKGANAADTISQASCEGLAKGLNATGRNNLKTCFEQEFNCGDCPAKFK